MKVFMNADTAQQTQNRLRLSVESDESPEHEESLASLKAEVQSLNFFYGKAQALKNVNLEFYENRVTAIIGPSGCGKSTLLRCFNRMHDLYADTRYEGKITLHPSKVNIIDTQTDPVEMRMRISMVFQKPNALP